MVLIWPKVVVGELVALWIKTRAYRKSRLGGSLGLWIQIVEYDGQTTEQCEKVDQSRRKTGDLD